MHNREIPSIKHLVELSSYNFQTIKNPFDKYNENKLYKYILDYYKNNSDIHTLTYKVENEGANFTVDTLLGVEENNKININNVKVHDSTFMQYDEDVIDSINFEVLDEETQSLTDVVYKDSCINIGRIDFKSLMTVSDLLLYEAVKSNESNNGDNFNIRNKILKNTSDFKQPIRPRGSTSGGVIIANTTDGWKMILGRRSMESNINRGKISIFPNGKVQYDDAIKNLFYTTLKREFTEELFDNNSQGDIFFDDYITVEPVSAGWNLRDGDLSVGYALIINSTLGYDMFKNIVNENKELTNLVEVPINDFDKIKNILDIDEMSGAPLSTVCEALMFIDNNKLYPDLSYNIESSADFDIV